MPLNKKENERKIQSDIIVVYRFESFLEKNK